MALECPNCRERLSFLRAIRVTAWGSFRCKACGSVLCISFARRMLAAGIWVAVLLFTMEFLQLARWGRFWSYAGMGAALVAILYFCEKIVLLDRRAFTCKRCGYDLQGLPENRCPECGAAFDPAERERILARIHSPPPKPKRRWVAVLIVINLALAVAAGIVAYGQASRAKSGRAAGPTTPPGSTTSQSDD